MTASIELPGSVKGGKMIQGVLALTNRRRSLRRLQRKYGSAFVLNVPIFGRSLVISDPAEIKELFMGSSEIFGRSDPNLGMVLGSGSMFALDGAEHRRRRKLLVPPFHGRRLGVYEEMIEQEALTEMATWPEGQEFAVMDGMMRITLNAILRAVFGAEGSELEQLRRILPRMVSLGSFLAAVPLPRASGFGVLPWGRFRSMRAEYDYVIQRLIEQASADTRLDERVDVLSLMLQATYDDGTRMTDRHIADELLTMLTAGHETTATTLAWSVERLRRHPGVLLRLRDDVRAGGSDLLEATITEVQRTRPVIDATARRTKVEGARLGRWVLPREMNVIASIQLLHENAQLFPNPERFDPDRFMGNRPDPYTWIPFGGGVRRCIGSAFALMEMKVVLRTVLREFELEPTSAPDEPWHLRGVAWAPKRGGLAMLHRRSEAPGEVVGEIEPASA